MKINFYILCLFTTLPLFLLLSCTGIRTTYTYEPEKCQIELKYGKKVAILSDSILTMKISLSHYWNNELCFDLEIYNKTDSDILISPEQFSIVSSIKNVDQEKGGYVAKALDPEDEIKRINAQITKLNTMEALNDVTNCCFAGMDVANTVSGKKTDEQHDKDREERISNHESISESHRNEIAGLESDRLAWETLSIRKKTLRASEQTAGKLYFRSVVDNPYFIVIAKIGRQKYSVNFAKQAFSGTKL